MIAQSLALIALRDTLRYLELRLMPGLPSACMWQWQAFFAPFDCYVRLDPRKLSATGESQVWSRSMVADFVSKVVFLFDQVVICRDIAKMEEGTESIINKCYRDEETFRLIAAFSSVIGNSLH